jgi:hypothetical protein
LKSEINILATHAPFAFRSPKARFEVLREHLMSMAGNRGVLRFKETDVRRAIRAVQAVGLSVTGIKIFKDGAIVVQSGKEESAATTSETEPAEAAFEAWKVRRNARSPQRD